eukprot:COSAG01_NODE_54724_length_330_cov_0.670996_1_plen_47_part_10
MSANAKYNLQPSLLYNKPHWVTVDGAYHVYWAPNRLGGQWVVDADTD